MKFIDFFSGAGGMRTGLERAGHTCVGFCEWDKYARQSYKAIFNTEGEWENHDIRTASSMELPRADLWTYGFPCQGISVAGKQKGIGKGAEDEEADERSNLFFQIIRLLEGLSEEDRPEWLLCENVKNLLSIDRGFGFLRVLCCLDEAGYDSEWQVFNTKYSYIVGETVVSGIPQNRERVYIISHLRRKGKREVFPIPRADGENIAELQQIGNMAYSENSVKNNSAAGRVYDKNGLAPTLRTPSGGGDMNLALLTENIPSEACCIDAIYNNRERRITEHCPTLRADRQGVCVSEPRAVLTPDREEKRQNGRRMKEAGEPMFTLTAQDRHGVVINETDTDKICKTN